MNIAKARQDIIDAVRSGMPHLREVTALGGRLDLDEVRRQSTSLPAVVVAALSVPVTEIIGGQLRVTVRWGAFIACADAPGPNKVSRDEGVLLLTGELLRLISSPEWPRRATKVSANSAWSTKLDRQGVAIWAVSWDEKLEVGRLSLEELDDLKTLGVTWDLVPSNGQPDAVDHIKLGEGQ